MGINDVIYDDFAWVPRIHLQKYFEKERYLIFVQSLLL